MPVPETSVNEDDLSTWAEHYVRLARHVRPVQAVPIPLEIDEKQAKRIDSLRYHAIGNAVTPPVAEWVGTRLAKVIAAQNLRCILSGDVQVELRLTA